MTASLFIQWAGIAAILTGPVLVGAGLVSQRASQENAPSYEWLYVVNAIVTIIAIVGLYFFQGQESGVFGLLGLALLLIAILIWALVGVIGEQNAERVSNWGYTLGLFALAIGSLTAGKLPLWAPILWLLAPILGVLGYLVVSQKQTLQLIGAIAAGLGFIGAGYTMWVQ